MKSFFVLKSTAGAQSLMFTPAADKKHCPTCQTVDKPSAAVSRYSGDIQADRIRIFIDRRQQMGLCFDTPYQ